jgi:phosphoribosylamine---glycine ligase
VAVKLLILDTDGLGLGLARKAAQHGHQVRWFIQPNAKMSKKIGQGFQGIKRVDNWLSSAAWADVIFPTFYDKAYTPRLDKLKENGAPVFSPSVASAELEIKRAVGMKVMAANGVPVPDWEQFANLSMAEKFVRKHGGRWVFKTLGDNEDKSLSYCSKSAADMVERIKYWQRIGLNPNGPVMLQEFIEGAEMGVSRWMGAKGWIGPPNENLEHKKLMPGGYGPNTGEMGTTSQYVTSSKLFDTVLQPLEKELLRLGHLGDIDANCIVSKKDGKPYVLELTCRPGWPAYNIMLTQHAGDPVLWKSAAIEGGDKLTAIASKRPAVGVVIAGFDFPVSKLRPEETEGVPIFGVTKQNSAHIHPQYVSIDLATDMQGEDMIDRPMWVTAGDYLAVVVGQGRTVKEAAEQAFKIVHELHVPNMIVREDCGHCAEDTLDELHKAGFAKEMRFS